LKKKKENEEEMKRIEISTVQPTMILTNKKAQPLEESTKTNKGF